MTIKINEQTYAIIDLRTRGEIFYKELFDELPIGYAFCKIIYDKEGQPLNYEFIEVNSIFEERTGLSKSDIIGGLFTEFFCYMEQKEFDRLNDYAYKAITIGKQEFELHYRYINKWYRVSLYSPIEDYLVMYFIGITNEKLQLIELEHGRRRIENIIEATNVGTWELNLQTGERFYNNRWAEMLGYTLEELSPINKSTWTRLVHPEDLKVQLTIDEKLYTREIDYYDEEYRMVHKDGSIIWIQDQGKVISWTEDGKPQIVSGTHTDITAKRKKQEEVLYLSYCDQLTGLYNRRYFEQKIKEIDIADNLPITLIMADVNGLKLVNDSFGHTLGDELLKKAADIIKKGCRKSDIISRLGGDEFVAILTNTSSAQAEQIIKRIHSMAYNEKVGAIDISISFGYETKKGMSENIHDILKNAEDYMYRHKLYESTSTRNKTIDLIMNTLYEKSYREMQHSKRVSKICVASAQRMNFDIDKINLIKIAGLMHDIGKMGIDENILNKPGQLTEDELREIQRHPEIGYRILSSSNEFSEIAEYVLKHHERLDGNGYPKGCKNEEISIQSRIIAIADAYDAMTSDRPYRKGMSSKAALEEINKSAGTQFDANITEIFTKMILEQQDKFD